MAKGFNIRTRGRFRDADVLDLIGEASLASRCGAGCVFSIDKVFGGRHFGWNLLPPLTVEVFIFVNLALDGGH